MALSMSPVFDIVSLYISPSSCNRILEESKKEFEEAARALFEHTITIGKELRPKALWGFYGFPDCYGTEKDDYQCIEKVNLY